MKVSSAEFVLGVANLRQLPSDGVAEVAFLGRSNVGKSSLINTLCGRKSLARVSTEPGKTRELNYYLINKAFHFVDLPGYGYARVPDQVRSSWGTMIEQYLKGRSQLRLAVQLVDARHGLSELDKMMVGWLDFFRIPFAVVLTKADKLPVSKMPRILGTVREEFESYRRCRDVIPFSSMTGLGKQEVVRLIAEHVAT